MVIEYFDVLAWPVVVLALVSGFFLLFRPNIAALIERIRHITTPLASLGTAPAAPQPDAPDLPEVDEPPPSAEPTTPPPAPDPQVNQLAAYVYYWYYEKVYRLTFGTQTAALEHINQSPAGADMATLLTFYLNHLNVAKLTDPTYNRDFNGYMGWLVGAQLATEQDGRYFITAIGRSFLAWMAAEGLIHKPGQ